MAKKETAEEKLLKIIEATQKAKEAPASATAAAPASVPVKRAASPKIIISFRQVNTVLAVAALAAFIFLVHEVQLGLSRLNEDVSLSVDLPAVKDAGGPAVPQLKTAGWYLDKVAARNIFQPYEKSSAGGQGVPSDRAALQTKIGKYKFVGVAWLDVPESATVMLENIATKETRFLKEGDKIEDVTVKTIYTDRAVFSYANEEITIKL